MRDAPYPFLHRAGREASDTDANSATNTIVDGSGMGLPLDSELPLPGPTYLNWICVLAKSF